MRAPFHSQISGSAPRMRGTRRGRRPAHRREGFSPAHAGNPPYGSLYGARLLVQPRACGEPARCRRNQSEAAGSAPRMRGTPAVVSVAIVYHRFSPAHAGNPRRSASRRCGRSVQPRACGEPGKLRLPEIPVDGSAPRMRGTQAKVLTDFALSRFSPAHAGNPTLTLTSRRLTTVQPRACGEPGTPANLEAVKAGSAPRMRGTRGRHPHAPGALRFSPAHAGNPRRPLTKLPFLPVQPRACGEPGTIADSGYGNDGSAPRMRGTLARSHDRTRCGRFSPAHAGNPSSLCRR